MSLGFLSHSREFSRPSCPSIFECRLQSLNSIERSLAGVVAADVSRHRSPCSLTLQQRDGFVLPRMPIARPKGHDLVRPKRCANQLQCSWHFWGSTLADDCKLAHRPQAEI